MTRAERIRNCNHIWSQFNRLSTILQDVTGTIRYDLPGPAPRQLRLCEDIEIALEYLHALIALPGNERILPLFLSHLCLESYIGEIDMTCLRLKTDLKDLSDSLYTYEQQEFYIGYVERRLGNFRTASETMMKWLCCLTREGRK